MGQLLFGNDGPPLVRQRRPHRRQPRLARTASPPARGSAIFRDSEDGRAAGRRSASAIVLTVGGDTATVIADRVRDALYAGDWVGTAGRRSDRGL